MRYSLLGFLQPSDPNKGLCLPEVAFCPVSADGDDCLCVDQCTEIITQLEKRGRPVRHDGGELLAEQGGVLPRWSLHCNIGGKVVFGECFFMLSHFIQVLVRLSKCEPNRSMNAVRTLPSSLVFVTACDSFCCTTVGGGGQRRLGLVMNILDMRLREEKSTLQSVHFSRLWF